jgi:uncharacterized protein
MATPRLIARLARPLLLEALTDSPAVLIHGPRQCGKTTLARTLKGYRYITFDDPVQLAAAKSDPVAFVSGLAGKTVLDEVQHVPELFRSLKIAIDSDRRAGRFVLTGSTNVLLIPSLSDSLAGRMELLPLYPLAQCEIAKKRSTFIDALIAADFAQQPFSRLGIRLAERIVAGGFPAALARPTGRRRREWYRSYIDTLIQRDIRELARISSLDAIPRLLELAATQSARLFNLSDLASPFQLSRPTIGDYVTLLERIFLVELLPPWHGNRLSRLIKTPKIHLGDTGLVSALLGLDAKALSNDRQLYGQLLESFVFHELRRQASWHDTPINFYHFRDRDQFEVDLVLELSGRKIAAVEIKATATVSEADFRGLRKLKDAMGSQFASGALMYDGESTVRFADNLFAVPIRALWETH